MANLFELRMLNSIEAAKTTDSPLSFPERNFDDLLVGTSSGRTTDAMISR